jgi:FAD/FMN-containing dehydrogenase
MAGEAGLPETLATAAERFQGELIVPGSAPYEEARKLFNAAHEKRPAAIVRCLGTADVVEAIGLARSLGLEIAVRSGGRHMAGFGSSEGGLVIDLGAMRAVKVDAEERNAWVQCGAIGIDLQAEAQVHGLAGITGVLTHTGIGRVNLNGGLGWLSGRLGWGADTILEAEVVTAAGEVLRVSPREHPDLFWAIRGAGANFGVVTWIKMRLLPIPEKVLAGSLFYPLDRAAEVMRFLREFSRTASPDFLFFVEFLFGRGDPELPEELRDGVNVVVNLLHYGEPAEAAREVGELRAALPPTVDRLAPRELVAYTRLMSGTYTRMRQWWDEEQVAELSEEAIELAVAAARRMEKDGLSQLSCLMLYPFRGALAREPEVAAAIARPGPGDWSVGSMLFWEDAGDDERHRAWSDRLMAELREAGLTTGRVYGNSQQLPDEERTRRSFGEADWARLREVKRQYDPENVFHLNHNIPPAD